MEQAKERPENPPISEGETRTVFRMGLKPRTSS